VDKSLFRIVLYQDKAADHFIVLHAFQTSLGGRLLFAAASSTIDFA
jgi:hypothetical protein